MSGIERTGATFFAPAEPTGAGPERPASPIAPSATAPTASASIRSESVDPSQSMADNPSAEIMTVSCLMNAHYHSSREAFLDNVHRWFMFGVIAFGAAALVDILPSYDRDWLKALFSALAAMLGALDLTF